MALKRHQSPKACIDELNLLERRQFLRGLCPCRGNSSENLEGWRELFSRARFGSVTERKAAAHSIGTLIEKAQQIDSYRELLIGLQGDLDELMSDPRSASQVLGVMKKHGHAHKGAARKYYRKAYSVFALQTPAEVASWLNRYADRKGAQTITTNSPIAKKLAQWLKHRAEFQPTRQTTEQEIIKRAKRLAPALFT